MENRPVQSWNWIYILETKNFLLTIFLSIIAFNLFSFETRKPEKTLSEVFPDAKIEVKNIILSEEKKARAEKLSGLKIETRLVSIYIARKDNNVVGYAIIDTHTVRTMPETVLYVITPEGKIDIIEVLAFREPLEYLPDERWLDIFKGKSLEKDKIRVRRDIPNVTGATLTSRAIADNARKVLAIWEVVADKIIKDKGKK